MKLMHFAPLLLIFVSCSRQPLLYVGTYTQKLGHVDGKASGIYTCRFNPKSGDITVIDSAVGVANPSFVTLAPDGKHLYAVGENGGKPGQPYGSVAAYSIGQNGHLQKINEVSSYGVAPCHVSTDRTGKFVFAANYSSGSILSYGIKPDGGLTDSICFRQHKGVHPWAHMVFPSPDNAILWSTDKGNDHVYQYKIESNGKLTQVSQSIGATESGPRHLDFHPSDPTLVAWINESNETVTIGRYNVKSHVFLKSDSLSTLPAGYKGANSCADIHFHPNGKFLYGSNRGHNSIVVYEVNSTTGKLKVVDFTPVRGEVPRNFLITPDGKWLLVAHQNSSTIASFKIDPDSGKLTPVGPVHKVPTPVCLKMAAK